MGHAAVGRFLLLERRLHHPPTDSAMRTNLIVSLFLSVFLSAAACAQVTLQKGAVVYTGSPANTTAPATIAETKVRAATPEWQKIEDEGIDPQSARGKQLITRMNSRISKAVVVWTLIEIEDAPNAPTAQLAH